MMPPSAIAPATTAAARPRNIRAVGESFERILWFGWYEKFRKNARDGATGRRNRIGTNVPTCPSSEYLLHRSRETALSETGLSRSGHLPRTPDLSGLD